MTMTVLFCSMDESDDEEALTKVGLGECKARCKSRCKWQNGLQ